MCPSRNCSECCEMVGLLAGVVRQGLAWAHTTECRQPWRAYGQAGRWASRCRHRSYAAWPAVDIAASVAAAAATARERQLPRQPWRSRNVARIIRTSRTRWIVATVRPPAVAASPSHPPATRWELPRCMDNRAGLAKHERLSVYRPKRIAKYGLKWDEMNKHPAVNGFTHTTFCIHQKN